MKPHGRRTMFSWGVKKKCSQRPRRYKKVCDLVAPAMNLKDFSILRSLTDTGFSHHFKKASYKKKKKKVVIILQNWNNLFEQMHPRWITYTYIRSGGHSPPLSKNTVNDRFHILRMNLNNVSPNCWLIFAELFQLINDIIEFIMLYID